MTTTLRTAAVTLLAFLALAATAWAYLGATGVGSGTGSVSAQPVEISAGTASQGNHTATLLPTGAATGTLLVKLTNNSLGPAEVRSLALRTTDTVQTGFQVLDAQGQPMALDCRLTYTTQTSGAEPWTVAAGGTRNLELAGAVSMGTDAPNACQGKTIRVLLKST